MKEITLTKQDMYKIIKEEVARFSEKIENDAIVDSFAKEFATVFAEALDKSIEDSVYKDMYEFVSKFRKPIIESTQDPSFLNKKEQTLVVENFSDREITKLISTLNESKNDNKGIVLEGTLFFGKDSGEIKLSEYKGREVVLDTIYLGKTKKFKVYVENKGSVERVEFGEKDFEIKRTDPKAKYPGIWVCKDWSVSEGNKA